MVGGGNSTNGFAALGSLRRKKNLDRSSKNGGSTNKSETNIIDPQAFWAPKPLTVDRWADVDDDDDYFDNPLPVFGSLEQKKDKESVEIEEVSGSEDDGIDEGDDEIEEESEPELPVKIETVKKIYAQVPLVAKEPERQLSKKELKKKELAELEAVLAALGIPKKQNCRQDEVHGVTQENKSEELNGDMEKKENVPTESKNMKKKKKKDKSLKVVNGQDHHNGSEIVNNGQDEAGGIEEADVKERLKKLASAKKKKPNKEMDTPAKAAAVEAAARRAKLAAAKKKEKNHYNQQPVRILEGNHSTGYHAAKVVSAIENYDHGADEPRINPVNSRYNLSIEFSRPACPVLIQNGVLANPLGSP